MKNVTEPSIELGNNPGVQNSISDHMGMRKIPGLHALGFGLWTSVWCIVTWVIWRVIGSRWGSEHPLLNTATLALCYVLVGAVWYRFSLFLIPFRGGEIVRGSRTEAIYHIVHLPFLFFLYYPVIFSGLLPLPFTRAFCRMFGARLSDNSYPGRCMLYDPLFVRVGRNAILGAHSQLIPHIIEAGRLAHYHIRIGDGVTIGVNAIILAGVTIGDRAIVAAGSVVPKFTYIGPGEIWGGLPAKRIGFAVKKNGR